MIFWGILAIVLFIVDALTSTALLIGFAISAIVTSILSVVMPVWSQIALFVIVGIILTVIIVPKLRKVPEVKNYSDALEGVTIKATSFMLANQVYQEKVKGTFWNVKSIDSDIVENQTMKIVKVDRENNCLIVRGE